MLLFLGCYPPPGILNSAKIPHSGRNAAPADIPPQKIPQYGEKSNFQQSLLPKRYPIRGEKHPPAVTPPEKIPQTGTEATARPHI